MTKKNCTSAKTKAQAKHEKYMARALKKHGDTFDFSEAFFASTTAKIKVTCNCCGETKHHTVANILYNTNGCRKCYHKNRCMTQAQYLKRVEEKHGGKYDYTNVKIATMKSVIEIVCPKHGTFKQRASDHLRHGCRECGKEIASGYSRSEFEALCEANNDGIGTLYVIKCENDHEEFYKVGITSKTVDERFKKTKYLPYKYQIISEITGSGGEIYDIETKFHEMQKRLRYTPKRTFNGYTECFSELTEDVKFLLQTI